MRRRYLIQKFVEYLDKEIEEWKRKFDESYNNKINNAMCFATVETLRRVKSDFLKIVDEVLSREVKITCWLCEHLDIYADVDFKTGEPFYEFYCKKEKDEFDVYDGLCDEFKVHKYFRLEVGDK